MKCKIIHDKDKCISCGACCAITKNWQLKGNKAEPKKTILNKKELQENKEAANVCPVQCIKIVEEK